MDSSLERILLERRRWRERNAEYYWRAAHRDTKVNERCELGWKNFSKALHKEIVRQNSLGKPIFGIRRPQGALEVQRMGKLTSLLMIALDRENAQIRYRSLMHEGSAIIGQEGAISAAFWGSLLLIDPDGRMIRFGYAEAAEFLLQPIVQA